MKMNLDKIKKMYDKYVLGTYTRTDLCLTKGEGVWVEDINGEKYLDFFPGWAVSGIGHRHPKVVKRVSEQLDRILHVSNNFYNDVQPLLAKKIIDYSFPGKVFFSKMVTLYPLLARLAAVVIPPMPEPITIACFFAISLNILEKGFPSAWIGN